jgi:LysM repeat protein
VLENCCCCRGFLHVIEKGDTLYKLGKQYGVTVSSLLYANPYINVYNLQVGDELCIPNKKPMLEKVVDN